MVKRRIPRRRRRGAWTPEHVEHLRNGYCLIWGQGFGLGENGRVLDGMEVAWRELREEILAEHIREAPGTRPWAWWVFERNLPQGIMGQAIDQHLGESQAEYLRRHKLLTKNELN